MIGGVPGKFRGVFRTDADARAVYSEGAGIQRLLPAAVAVPVDVEDLTALVEWAKGEGAALIPRGSGSGMAGGAIGPGVIVDVSRWKHVDTSRLDEKRLIAQPGVICAEVQRVARERGLRFPVSPSSAAFCTVGGMTATNAAGAHSLAYGAMREWVQAIDCVWADGRQGSVRRGLARGLEKSATSPRVHEPASPRKNSSGYFTEGDEVDLFVGSEGTLAFFSAIEVKLTEEPATAASVMGIFPSLAAATEAAINAREAGAAACELLDRTFLEFVNVSGAEAILLVDVEGTDAGDAHSKAESVARAFTSAGASEVRRAETHDERERLWELRHAASPILSRLSAQLKSMQFIEDGCVPPDKLGAYIAGVRAALDRQKIRGVIFGHAGDAHIHVNPLVDVTQPDWRTRVEQLLDEVTGLVATLGGTLAGEHGDGRIRTPLLPRVWDSAKMAEFSAIKQKYDPDGLLNPGIKVGAAPGIGPIKYDPLLAPHPAAVATALARVERERAYAQSRLDLLTA